MLQVYFDRRLADIEGLLIISDTFPPIVWPSPLILGKTSTQGFFFVCFCLTCLHFDRQDNRVSAETRGRWVDQSTDKNVNNYFDYCSTIVNFIFLCLWLFVRRKKQHEDVTLSSLNFWRHLFTIASGCLQVLIKS